MNLLKKLWSFFSKDRVPKDESLVPERQSSTSDEPIPFEDLRPSVTEIREVFVLPLYWSLHYALTDGQWNDLRKRHKREFPNWEKCGCPQGCRADSLDEQWEYNRQTHTKIFVGAKFICKGCHWLKSPTWRIETYMKQRSGKLPPLLEPPHIIRCLGWTQERVDALRTNDLEEHRQNTDRSERLHKELRKGNAVLLPTSLELLPPERRAELVKPGQFVIVPWRVNLAALRRYYYSRDEIAVFEERMNKLAAKRLFSPPVR
jgi:hypothetical protein